MHADLVTLLGNLNYILLALAFMLSNILYLRILTIFSSICAVIYYLNYLENPLWINVFWESTFISINLFQIFLIFYSKRSVYFDEEEKKIYDDIFPQLTTTEYRKLLQISNFVDAEKGEILIEQGTQVLYLILICHGLVSVEIDENISAYCGVGNLLGEMSFVSGKPATATVRVVQPTRYIVWLQKDLEKLLHNNPEMLKSMQIVFNNDLIKKLNSPHIGPEVQI